ncbi:hypothetical protein [Extensimonas sp. H3M7-6]|uniref:hypothetical protein n=1 Tax=Extensimonas soli TaxID=3031322 RepID=UPI0023DBB722|nr:hypothetical protein [Extensimonas sp. H3M7-6]
MVIAEEVGAREKSAGKERRLAACRTLGVESENGPQRGQFLPDSQPHSGTMGQEDGKKWAAAAHAQPTVPKSDRLLGHGRASAAHKGARPRGAPRGCSRAGAAL